MARSSLAGITVSEVRGPNEINFDISENHCNHVTYLPEVQSHDGLLPTCLLYILSQECRIPKENPHQ